jgi:hypothetical protein
LPFLRGLFSYIGAGYIVPLVPIVVAIKAGKAVVIPGSLTALPRQAAHQALIPSGSTRFHVLHALQATGLN